MPKEEVKAAIGDEKFVVHVSASASPSIGRRVYITAEGQSHTSPFHLALNSESAHRLAVVLFGLSENFAEPITKAEADIDFLDGDLVMIEGVEGGYENGSCLIWDNHGKVKPAHGLRYVARSHGTGLYLHAEGDMTLYKHREKLWRGYEAPRREDLRRR